MPSLHCIQQRSLASMTDGNLNNKFLTSSLLRNNFLSGTALLMRCPSAALACCWPGSYLLDASHGCSMHKTTLSPGDMVSLNCFRSKH